MSKIPIRKYAYRLMVFSVIMAAIGAIVQFCQQYFEPHFASPAIPFIVLFFFFITLITLYIVMRNPSQITGKKFIAGYMLSRIIKMFSIFIFFILYLVFNKEDRWSFTGAFIVIYFAFSIFEIFALKKEP